MYLSPILFCVCFVLSWFWLCSFGACAFQTVLWFELFCSVVVVGLVAGVLLFVFDCRGLLTCLVAMFVVYLVWLLFRQCAGGLGGRLTAG